MSKTKFFRVACEGQTATDGRTITREMLTECAETFNPDVYGVRINMEHLRGFTPDGPFNAYGDVLALKTEEVTLAIGGKDETRLALFAQLDPTDVLIEVNRKRQKVYTSIEPQPNFGGTGKYGLVGLAVTDSPASLGTEMLKFSTRTDDPAAVELKADLDRRKSSKDSFFSAALETSFELEADGGGESAFDKALGRFSAILDRFSGNVPAPAKPADPTKPAEPAGGNAELTAALGTFAKDIADAVKAQGAETAREVTLLRADVDAVKKDIEGTPSPRHTSRPNATGGAGAYARADY